MRHLKGNPLLSKIMKCQKIKQVKVIPSRLKRRYSKANKLVAVTVWLTYFVKRTILKSNELIYLDEREQLLPCWIQEFPLEP